MKQNIKFRITKKYKSIIMKHSLILSLLLVSNLLIAQQYSGNISDFKLSASDVVIFPYSKADSEIKWIVQNF